jgi:hypothetical protein
MELQGHRSAQLRRIASAVALCATMVAPGAGAAQSTTCQFRGTAEALAERPSPLDSIAIRLGDGVAKLCYGRPAARGRTVIGGQDPYGAPWRLGANEPTTLHLPFAASIGGVAVGPGSYSLYAIPDARAWTIVVNGNTNRWGIPIGADVRAADIGSFTVPSSDLAEHVETLELSFVPRSATSGEIVYRWERTTFAIPIAHR